jgi:hypothetical protein
MNEFIILILIPSVTALLVAIVTWTGFQQHKLAKEKFKLDMFEKRFAVYKGVQVFLTIILQKAKFDLNDLFEFRRKTQDSTFLFGKDIPEYIDGIDKKALKMMAAKEAQEPLPVGPQRSDLCEEKSRLLMELIDELPRLKEVFSPYLLFDKWK